MELVFQKLRQSYRELKQPSCNNYYSSILCKRPSGAEAERQAVCAANALSNVKNIRKRSFFRGNNPLTIRLFPELGCYLYASTDEILDMALDTLGLSGLCQADIHITQGDIMAIDAKGRRTTARFDDAKLRPQRYFFDWGQWERAAPPRELDDYMEMVLEYGQRRGVPEAELRLLMDAGYDAFDIEQLLYDHEGRESCIREIMADFGVC